jgi:DNA-binding PadR family transcriptional regulator
MYDSRIDDGGETRKTTYRLGEASRNYYRRLAENREALDTAFEKYVQNQKLASIGAALQLNKMAASKAPGSATCADGCSCLYCQKLLSLQRSLSKH